MDNQECPDGNTLLNYASGLLREDFVCFDELKMHEIKCHVMLCGGCSSEVDRYLAQLPDQTSWFKGCKPL